MLAPATPKVDKKSIGVYYRARIKHLDQNITGGSVADIYNLNPYFCARHMAHQLIQCQGADFFALCESDAPAFRLDPRKVDRLVNSALDAARIAAPHLPTSAHDLHLCRTKLENELLKKFVASHVFDRR